jgi:hypothetical protein
MRNYPYFDKLSMTSTKEYVAKTLRWPRGNRIKKSDCLAITNCTTRTSDHDD